MFGRLMAMEGGLELETFRTSDVETLRHVASTTRSSYEDKKELAEFGASRSGIVGSQPRGIWCHTRFQVGRELHGGNSTACCRLRGFQWRRKDGSSHCQLWRSNHQ